MRCRFRLYTTNLSHKDCSLKTLSSINRLLGSCIEFNQIRIISMIDETSTSRFQRCSRYEKCLYKSYHELSCSGSARLKVKQISYHRRNCETYIDTTNTIKDVREICDGRKTCTFPVTRRPNLWCGYFYRTRFSIYTVVNYECRAPEQNTVPTTRLPDTTPTRSTTTTAKLKTTKEQTRGDKGIPVSTVSTTSSQVYTKIGLGNGTETATKKYVNEVTSPVSPMASSQPDVGGIIGGVIGAFILACAIILLYCYITKRKMKKGQSRPVTSNAFSQNTRVLYATSRKSAANIPELRFGLETSNSYDNLGQAIYQNVTTSSPIFKNEEVPYQNQNISTSDNADEYHYIESEDRYSHITDQHMGSSADDEYHHTSNEVVATRGDANIDGYNHIEFTAIVNGHPHNEYNHVCEENSNTCDRGDYNQIGEQTVSCNDPGNIGDGYYHLEENLDSEKYVGKTHSQKHNTPIALPENHYMNYECARASDTLKEFEPEDTYVYN